MANLKLGKKTSRRCKWCRTWVVHECGNSHSGMFGKLNCSQCDNKGVLCADSGHPTNRRRSDFA